MLVAVADSWLLRKETSAVLMIVGDFVSSAALAFVITTNATSHPILSELNVAARLRICHFGYLLIRARKVFIMMGG